MPERKTILNVSHVCISSFSLSLVNVEVFSSDLALWSASRAPARASHATQRSPSLRPHAHTRRAWDRHSTIPGAFRLGGKKRHGMGM